MEKFYKILVLILLIFCSQSAIARTPGCYYLSGYRYIDEAYLYTDIILPHSANADIPANPEPANKIYAVSKEAKNREVSVESLKRGKGTKKNILRLVEFGNAGIYKAAKDANIHKIHFVETNWEKVYIPMIIFPIYIDRLTTIIYGE